VDVARGLGQHGGTAGAGLPHGGHDPAGGERPHGPRDGVGPGRRQVPQRAGAGLGLDTENLAARRRSGSGASGSGQHERGRGARRGLSEGEQKIARRPGPGGDVDGALEATGDRVEDRDRGAGVGAQAERVVLLSPDDRRHAVGERQAEAVGAGFPLGEREPRRKVDGVQRAQQRGVAAESVEHEALGVGEHQADRLAGQCAVQAREHLLPALEDSVPASYVPVNTGATLSSDTP
jgi:hypothetical protein